MSLRRQGKRAAVSTDVESPAAQGCGRRAPIESMPDFASSDPRFTLMSMLRGSEPPQSQSADPALVSAQIHDVLTRASAVVLPTARSLHWALAAAEVAHVAKGVLEMCEKLALAGVLIYLAQDGRRECGQIMIPVVLWRLALCMIAAAVAGLVLLLPEGRMMEAVFHCLMTARYRATGRHKAADLEAQRCVGQCVFAARLFMVASFVLGVAETLGLIFWLLGSIYTINAPGACSGPVWFNFWNLRPALPSLFSFVVISALIVRSSRDKFLMLAQSTAKLNMNALATRPTSSPATAEP